VTKVHAALIALGLEGQMQEYTRDQSQQTCEVSCSNG
jgi:hypothetical protein